MPGILIYGLSVAVLMMWAMHQVSKLPFASKEEQDEHFKKILELPPF